MDLITYISRENKTIDKELVNDIANIIYQEDFSVPYHYLIKYGAVDCFTNHLFNLVNNYNYINGVDYIVKETNEIFLTLRSFKLVFLRSNSVYISQFLDLEDIIRKYLISRVSDDSEKLITELKERIESQNSIIDTLREQLEEQRKIINNTVKQLSNEEAKAMKLEDELDYSLEQIQKLTEERDELNYDIQGKKDIISSLEIYKKEYMSLKNNLERQNKSRRMCNIS